MHPAASLIAFTTLSGAGFGLLAFMGIGLGVTRGWAGAGLFGLGFGLALTGLAASTAHLGRPERALKAFREWRSSWLSREAWLAVAALGTLALFAALRQAGLPALVPGLFGAALALVTVAATAMIYAQLRTVPRWHHWSTPAIFLAHAVTAGAVLSGLRWPAIILLLGTALAQFLAWKSGDARMTTSTTTRESATGLGHIGQVRPFEPPHTGDSYLTREMVFVIGRKHALKLRSIALAVAYFAPVAVLLVPWHPLTTALAAALHLGGTALTRWLFFAEAEHVLSRYYR